jgi:hypothetical protein
MLGKRRRFGWQMRNRQKLKAAKDIKKDIFEIERRKFFELDKRRGKTDEE